MKDGIKIVAIDFDGVIVPERFPNIEGLVDGAKETIKDLHEMGYELILWTSRTNTFKDEHKNPGGYLLKAMMFLEEEGLLKYFKAINDNIYEKHDCRKVYAHMYIDDRNLLGFPGWDKVREILL